ncbi:hypothetical protein DL96DRAFT_1270617 [Flagelloscypha sp. PMI_526]|nr:hypothetical protein DL96DRAFT_1270617 [Flagelloscypha sp. PMI_526]
MENYDIFISGALQLSGLVLLYYDHALTLSTEFRYLWKRPFFLGSILFFCNRYLAFFGHFPIAYYNFIQVSFHVIRDAVLSINMTKRFWLQLRSSLDLYWPSEYMLYGIEVNGYCG